MKLELPKGMRDFPPEEMILRESTITLLKNVFEKYGFNPMDTPSLERFNTLSAKYAGGDEILKETFKLTDQGKRKLGLRYDLTVPFSRFIGMNPQIRTPFKRYQIGKVYRDGPIKLGRYREFTQCDVDIVGVDSAIADAELLMLVAEVFEKLELKVRIKLNSRKIINAILEALDCSEEDKIKFVLSLDKLEKIGVNGVIEDLKERGVKNYNEMSLLLSTCKIDSIDELENYIKNAFKKKKKTFEDTESEKGFEEIKEILQYLKDNNADNVFFDGTLARGLAYYTGPVFEVFLEDSEIKSSVAGGGRYDKMIGDYLEDNRKYPATGISFGLEPILEAIKMKSKETKISVVKVFVIPINTLKESLKIVQKLRKENINSDIWSKESGISKALDYANKSKIPYVLIIGENELKLKQVKLKNMTSGEEKLISLDKAIKELKQ